MFDDDTPVPKYKEYEGGQHYSSAAYEYDVDGSLSKEDYLQKHPTPAPVGTVYE